MFFMMIMVGSILYTNDTLGLLLDVINWRIKLNRSISCLDIRCSSLAKSEVPKYLEGPIQVLTYINSMSTQHLCILIK